VSTPPRPASVPWRVGDLTLTCALSTVGALAIVGAWFGCSGSLSATTEERWLAVGIIAAVVAGVGNGLWLLAGHRAVRQRSRAVTSRLLQLADPATDLQTLVEPAARPVSVGLVATSAMGHYHRGDCHLVHGKDVRHQNTAQHVKAGRRPCGMCRPDEVAA
jgi:hypothetical protein